MLVLARFGLPLSLGAMLSGLARGIPNGPAAILSNNVPYQHNNEHV